MAEHVHTDGPIWALDWLCIIVGVLLLAAWVLSAQEMSFLLGLVLFILGCALRSRWQTKLLKDDMEVVDKKLS
jgi:Flp pilus assembly protein TadB